MKTRRPYQSVSIYGVLLRSAALFVPPSQREEWLAEWQSELWYLRHDAGSAMIFSARVNWSALQFCLGSFRDALWLRRHDPNPTYYRLWLQSPTVGIILLVIGAALAWSLALWESALQPPYMGSAFLQGQVFILGAALLLVRISTPFGPDEYSETTDSSAREVRLRWWIFLGIKAALVLPIAFCGTLDLGPPLASTGMSPHATLIGYFLGFRWVFRDQRRRCPVCLRLLTNPVRIGQPAYTMLEWYGTN